jgi:hypothetical protein
MIVYLAGPMSGKPDFNWPEFKRVTKLLRDSGVTVVCPTESGANHNTPYHECLKADLKLLLSADSITFLLGWTKSKGATFEAVVAYILGYKFFHLDVDLGILLPGPQPSLWSLIKHLVKTHVGLEPVLDTGNWGGLYKDIIEAPLPVDVDK